MPVPRGARCGCSAQLRDPRSARATRVLFYFSVSDPPPLPGAGGRRRCRCMHERGWTAIDADARGRAYVSSCGVVHGRPARIYRQIAGRANGWGVAPSSSINRRQDY
jgi:hypothetical protein